MPLADGQVIAGYTILRSLGAGGMGEVYLAQHPRLPRRDALKVLSAAVCSESEYRKRFNREADIAATLWHPHIVEVHDRGDVDGQLWISMDYVEGTDAAHLLAESYQDGMAPDYAHQRRLLHRDVKPANILMANPGAADERIMLADFGVSRWLGETSTLTGTNMTVGTVAYAAPEQLKGEDVDGRADQYALAATAFQLLTGAPPFQHSNPAVVIRQHLTADPPKIGTRRPELSGLGPVFDKALAKSPDDRYNRCIDFARALAHNVGAAAPHPGDAEATMVALAVTGPRHARAEAKSRRRIIVPVAVAALAAIAIAAVTFVVADRGRRNPAEAKPKSSATPTSSATQSPGNITLPVVVVGANCATLGAAGITQGGAPAYCAHLPTTNAAIWSSHPGEISSPTAAAGANDEVYPSETESPVLVCMEQTGQTHLDCHDDILQSNATGSATPP